MYKKNLVFVIALLLFGCNTNSNNDGDTIGQFISDLNKLSHSKSYLNICLQTDKDAVVELNLAGNSLLILPENLIQFKKLKSLNLSGNQIDTLPDLTCFAQLEYLDLAGNKLKTIPRLSGLTNLRELNLMLNKDFPSNLILDLPTSLEVLNLNSSGISKLTLLHSEKLTNLETVDVEGNDFLELPESLNNLPNLKKLKLRLNRINKLDPDIVNRLNVLTYTPSYLSNKEQVLQVVSNKKIEIDTIWLMPDGREIY